MTVRIVVLPLAANDLIQAATWYDRQAPGLGTRFLESVDKTFQKIEDNPLRYSAIRSNVRQAHMDDFPYTTFFRVESDAVYVFACLHQKRNPAIWTRRPKTQA